MYTPRCSLLAVLGAAATVFTSSGTVAEMQQQNLGDAQAVFPEPFSRIVGLRELSDGRVLIADQLERQVSFIDFASGEVDQVGRRGQGPGEYESPRGLLPLSSDASMLVDFGTMRMTRVEPDGRLTQSWPLISTGEEIRIVRPTASDALSNVYHSSVGTFNIQREHSGPEPIDSAAVLRWNLETDIPDTVAMLYAPLAVSSSSARRGRGGFSFNIGGGARITGFQRRPFLPRDSWTVTADGRVAVVRASEYRVDWYAPDGRVTRGPVVDHDPVRITNAEKEAWADQQGNQQMTMRMLSGSGGGGGGGSRTFQAPRPDVEEIEFPEFKPPFGENAASVTPDGTVWVRRSQRHDEAGALYDVFDAAGERVRQVRLRENRQVVGFGAGVVYVVVIDDDDLQWLERYKR